MRPTHTPNREEQALLEVGRTAIRPWAARALVALFLLTIFSVSLLEPLQRDGAEATNDAPLRRVLPAGLPELVGRISESRAVIGEAGMVAANRELQAAIHEFETGLEDDSFLRRGLLPPVQSVMTSRFGLGNEQAYVGRDGWLFYRPDVDYATGPGFLRPEVLLRRSRGGNAWRPAPQPDPRVALEQFRDRLGERGIRLLLLPTPVKPMLHPAAFAARAAGTEPRNPSWQPFLAWLEELGIDVLDVVSLLVAERAAGDRALYLETDTHWTPATVELVARELAREIERRVDLAPPDPDGFLRRSAVVDGRGDIAVMLNLPENQELFATQRVTVSPVLSGDGSPWKPDRDAEVLLLGDSFSNIYSQPGLGWGSGAGLAEQLSYFLQRQVDRIALNAGGAHATRQALARELAAGEDRLAGKRIVIYQFAVRELAIGDWKVLERPEDG